VYVDAPEPVNVAVLPAHNVTGLATALIVGFETVNVTVLVFVQPVKDLPVTVYVVVIVGETTVVEPVKAPGFQV
jgi:hypothetical protein